MIQGCVPEIELSVQVEGERTWIRMGDGTDEVVDSRRWPLPGYLSVLRSPASKGRGQPRILRNPGGRARPDPGKGLLEKLRGSGSEFMKETQGSVFHINRHWPLSNDVPCISLLGHVMKCHPGLALPVNERPIYRGTPPILGQEGAMEIDPSPARDSQKFFREKPTIIEGQNEIRRKPTNQADEGRRIGAGGGMDGDMMGLREFGHRSKPYLFVWIILMRDHRNDRGWSANPLFYLCR